jgi:serine/threonine-protein kinase RsbT
MQTNPMQTTRRESVPITSGGDVVSVRQLVRAWTTELGFSLIDQTKLVTACSELARNTFEHGGGGEAIVEMVNEVPRKGLRITFADRGRGIADIELALKDGYTTGNGLGLGLGGARRLVQQFEIASKPGEGTRITIMRWK